MPRYRAKSMLFVDGARRRPGEMFVSESPPTDQWEALDAPGEANPERAKAAAKAEAPAKDETKPLEGDVLDPNDPFADKDDEWLRNYIETRTGKAPNPTSIRPTLLRKAKAIAEGED